MNITIKIRKVLSDGIAFVKGMVSFALMLFFIQEFIMRDLQDGWYYLVARIAIICGFGILGLFYIERCLDPEIPAHIILKKYQEVFVEEVMPRQKGVAIRLRTRGIEGSSVVRFWRKQKAKPGERYIFTGRKLEPIPTI